MSWDSNTARIYHFMETLEVNTEELAVDMNMDEKKVQQMVDDGMPNEETQELIDRIICINVERTGLLLCDDEETEDEILQYIMENPSKEICHRLEKFRDDMFMARMERLEIQSREISQTAEEICCDLARLQRVYYQGKAVHE